MQDRPSLSGRMLACSGTAYLEETIWYSGWPAKDKLRNRVLLGLPLAFAALSSFYLAHCISFFLVQKKLG